MSIYDEKLWKCLEEKVHQEDTLLPADQRIGDTYLSDIRKICDFAILRAKTIRDTFPMYTLHDETHIINVLRIMGNLLGSGIDTLSRDEAAILVLAACCHDIGMSYSDEDRNEVLADSDRLNKYLDHHPKEYTRVYAKGLDQPEVSEDIIRNYLRSIHHERVAELLYQQVWSATLAGRVDVEDLIIVCRSHGENLSILDDVMSTLTVDLRFCAILLRLADILDFDTSRAPQALYEYCGFDEMGNPESVISRGEWDKHRASLRFDFDGVGDRSIAYNLPYHARCFSMQVQQAINCYLDWVDQELLQCGTELRRYRGRWESFVLPAKVQRHITSVGYVSGQYRLSLDQSKVLNLLVGDDLYTNPAVFVRELIQNAIDAVRTRERMDRNLPRCWKPQINIRTWIDNEGYHWFRIEDNGIGMSKDIIKNHLLKVGSSYYTSDQFRQDKIRCNVDKEYTPISRFGIGILSCFMGDTVHNQVEISTKRFSTGPNDYPPALRLQMHGLSGYYSLYSQQQKSHHPGPMKGQSQEEKREYLQSAGTVVAVKTNLYQNGQYNGFKEIVDKYVIYPPVPIHYEGPEGTQDYLTQSEFLERIHAINPSDDLEQSGLYTYTLTDEQIGILHKDCPELVIIEPITLHLKCVALDQYTESPNLSGAMVIPKVSGTIKGAEFSVGGKTIKMKSDITIEDGEKPGEIALCIKLLPEDKYNPRAFSDLDHFSNYDFQDALSKRRESIIRFAEEQGVSKELMGKVVDRFPIAVSEKPFIEDLLLEYGFTKAEQETVGNKIINILGAIHDSPLTDIETSLAIRNKKRKWSFTMCNLLELPWYKSLFSLKLLQTESDILYSHNGILCGQGSYLSSNHFSPGRFNAIILLQDRYRPVIGLSRDQFRNLPLEASIDYNLILEELREKGYDFPYLDYFDDNDSDIKSAKEYCELIEQREDFQNRIRTKSSLGRIPLNGLIRELKNDRTRITIEMNLLMNRIYGDHLENLYLSYLQEKYTLYAQKNRKGLFEIIVKATPYKYPFSKEQWMEFPVCFFLPIEGEGDSILTTKDVYDRYFCNSKHRLSIFLINNVNFLQRYAAGLFRELIIALVMLDMDDLIDRVNNLLGLFQKIHGNPVTVPDSLLLNKNDFY